MRVPLLSPTWHLLMNALARTTKRVVRYIGFRGAALVLFGFAFVGVGLGVLGNPQTGTGLIHTQLPIWFRVGLWVGSGLFAIATATTCPRWQSYGFGVLLLAPAERFLSYSFELVRDLVEHNLGFLSLISGVILWSVFTLAIGVATSGEPRRVRVRAVWVAGLVALVITILLTAVVLEGYLSLRWVGSSAVYFLFCALITLISAWPEPPPVTRVEEHGVESGRL